jgi:trimeric autotransporter adhesin
MKANFKAWLADCVWPLCLCSLLVLALVGCGSGGGGGSDRAATPAEPSLSLEADSIKTFRFTWTGVSGATEYGLLENPDGFSGYTQVATIAADAVSHDLGVFLPARVNASYILQACNNAGCADSMPVFVSGTLDQAIGYFKASNTTAGDHFGRSVALSGDGSTLAVGATGEDSAAIGIDGNQNDNSAASAGAVYVFTRTAAGVWSQQAYVKASNTDAGDQFGHAVALSGDGNTLAVGAISEDSAATGIGGNQNDNSAASAGAVYVFTRTAAGVWSQQAYVKASNTGPGNEFGDSVALSADGSTLAVGAIGEPSAATGINGDQNDTSAASAGAAYVFTRADNGAWSQQAYLKASNTNAGDRFGSSVALSGDGNSLAVGGTGEASAATGINGNQNDNSAASAGAVYVFTRTAAGVWSQQAYVKASNTDAGDQFGHAVTLSVDGNTLAVGAFGEASAATGIGGNENDNSVGGSGAAYVFIRTAVGAWSQQAYVKASNTGTSDLFGVSVVLSGDGSTLAVGAFFEDSAATGIGGDQNDNSAGDAGAVYLY